MAAKKASDWIIYGATGYTGRLIVEQAISRGMRPTVAGRNSEKVQAVAEQFGLPWAAFPVTDTAATQSALADKKLLLSVAGPFSATAEQMMTACIETGTHYLDVTGEIDVFELAARKDTVAKSAGVTLLPGVGFDVVPSDCLAAHTANHSKNPISLRLAIKGLGGPSRGTAKTVVEGLGQGTAVRRGGQIKRLRPGSLTHSFDFGNGAEDFLAVNWGDVSTAYHSTSIGDIEVYFPHISPIKEMTRLSRYLRPLVATRFVQSLMKRQIDKMPAGPSEAERNEAGALLRAEVTDECGSVFISQLTTPNGYNLTAESAVLCAQKTMNGEAEPGFKTPSLAFGPRLLDELSGCKIDDH